MNTRRPVQLCPAVPRSQLCQVRGRDHDARLHLSRLCSLGDRPPTSPAFTTELALWHCTCHPATDVDVEDAMCRALRQPGCLVSGAVCSTDATPLHREVGAACGLPRALRTQPARCSLFGVRPRGWIYLCIGAGDAAQRTSVPPPRPRGSGTGADGASGLVRETDGGGVRSDPSHPCACVGRRPTGYARGYIERRGTAAYTHSAFTVPSRYTVQLLPASSSAFGLASFDATCHFNMRAAFLIAVAAALASVGAAPVVAPANGNALAAPVVAPANANALAAPGLAIAPAAPAIASAAPAPAIAPQPTIQHIAKRAPQGKVTGSPPPAGLPVTEAGKASSFLRRLGLITDASTLPAKVDKLGDDFIRSGGAY